MVQGGHSERGGKKDFSTPTFQHVPLSCPFLVTVTMSFQSESAATSAPASCQITEFSLMPNYGVVNSTCMHMAVVKMSTLQCPLHTVSCANRGNISSTEIFHFTFILALSLFLSLSFLFFKCPPWTCLEQTAADNSSVWRKKKKTPRVVSVKVFAGNPASIHKHTKSLLCLISPLIPLYNALLLKIKASVPKGQTLPRLPSLKL